MKRALFILILLCLPLIIFAHLCHAEKIYYESGKVVEGKILYRDKSSIWLEHPKGSIPTSVNGLEKILNDDGSVSKYDFKGLFKIIEDYVREGKYSEAANTCDLLLESFPNSFDIHYLRGTLNQRAGNYDKSAEDYNFIIDKKNPDAKVFNNFGVMCADSKNYQKAVDLFVKATSKNPDMAEAHQNLAESFKFMQQYDRAIEEYNLVIQLEPYNTMALYNLGMAYFETKDYPKAKEQWEKILTLKPEDDYAKAALEYLNRRQ